LSPIRFYHYLFFRILSALVPGGHAPEWRASCAIAALYSTGVGVALIVASRLLRIEMDASNAVLVAWAVAAGVMLLNHRLFIRGARWKLALKRFELETLEQRRARGRCVAAYVAVSLLGLGLIVYGALSVARTAFPGGLHRSAASGRDMGSF
jgi:hypothetical protein